MYHFGMVTYSDALEIVRQRLDGYIEQIEAIRGQRKALDEEEKRLVAAFSAWYQVYKLERGIADDTPAASDSESESPSLFPSESEQSNENLYGALSSGSGEDQHGRKTAAVRQALEDAGQQGLTPRQLTAILRLRGYEISAGFSGNTLFRLKQKGVVAPREDGTYVLASLISSQVQEELNEQEVSEETS
jgi:hypothetical protein